jgi:tetratricopeptide (TPR) repeat protein
VQRIERSDAAMAGPLNARSRQEQLEEFAADLRKLRAASGLTLREMEGRAHYHYAQLAKAAQGKAVPSWNLTSAYLWACGVTGAAEVEPWRAAWEALRAAPVDREQNTSDSDAADSATEREAVFVSRLAELRQRAGSPTLSQIHEHGRRRFAGWSASRTSLSEWLTGHALPRNTRSFEQVLAVLGATGAERGAILRLLSRIKSDRAQSPRNRTSGDHLSDSPQAAESLASAGSVAAEQSAGAIELADSGAYRQLRDDVIQSLRKELTPHRVPSQLPLDLVNFTGRHEHLSQLRDLVSVRDPARPPIAVISGPGGVGKTSLAVRLGHQVRKDFPDGQIYMNMHGATEPRDSGAALTDLLLSLNLPDFAIPADPERRSAMLRSELSGRRVLIILDDVANAEQIAPLMPGAGASAVIITSRNQVFSLIDAALLRLDPFSFREAAEVLSSVAGPGRVDPKSPEFAEIIHACGGLPLAIQIVGSRLAGRPDLTVKDLAVRLRDVTSRLDELSIDQLAIRTSVNRSYDALSPEAARLYRLIGHFALDEFSASALEAVASPTSVRRSLDRLIEASLVQVTSVDQGGTARYRIHDLLRLHALEIGNEEQKAQAVQDVKIVFSAILDKMRRASNALPYEFFGVPEHTAPLGGSDAAPFNGADAIAWFDSERSTFVSVIRAAAQNGLHGLAWRIAAAWGPYLDMRAGFDDWNESHQPGLASAITSGDRRGAAILHRNLGQLALYQDDWDAAWYHLTAAAELFAEVGDRFGAGITAVGLGTWLRECGRPDEGLAHYENAIEAFVEVGDSNGEAVARSAAASIWLARNDTVTAGRYLAEALLLGIRRGDRHREAKVRRRIAVLRIQQGRPEQAVRQLQASLAIFTEIGDDHCATYTRADLGPALVAVGEDAAARKMLLDAVEIGHRLGDRSVEGEAAYQLGRLHVSKGNIQDARRHLSRAAEIWVQTGNDARVAECLRQLADIEALEA